MAHALFASDRDQYPAYLEATTRASASLYGRYGFELLGEVQAGSSPSLFLMPRSPGEYRLSPTHWKALTGRHCHVRYSHVFKPSPEN